MKGELKMKNKYPFIIVVIFGIIINFFCFLLFGFSSKASNVSNPISDPLPYYVNYYKDSYFQLNETWENWLNNYINNYSPNFDIYWLSEPYYWNSNYSAVNLYCCDFESLNVELKSSDLNYNVDYGLFDFSENYVVLSGNIKVNTFTYRTNNINNLSVYGTSYTSSVSLLGSHSINNIGFTPCYPFYLKDGSILYFNNKIVFVNGEPALDVIVGHATAPINNSDLIIKDNDIPIHKPNFPTINNYSWTNYNNPPIDTFSVETLLQSLWSSLVYNFTYLFSNLSGLFNTLTNNLENFVNYIVDSLFYVSNNIVSAIQDFATDFYNNMVSLFEPILDTLSYFVEPLDVDQVETALESTSFYSLVSVGSTFKDTFSNYFDSITVPSSLSFHIPYTILTKQGYIDFDFGWYNGVKNSVLPWIVGFLYAGFGLALFRSIPSLIHGVSGVSRKGA